MVCRRLPEVDRYSYGARPRVGAPKVSLCWDTNSVRLLMGVVGEVHPWVSAPIYATNPFCLVVLAPRIPYRRSYTFPVQRFHVRDPPLVPSDGS